MNAAFFVIISLSFSGSLLALLLLVLKPFIKNKLSQSWQYYIWLIVIIRFLLPFTPQFSLIGETIRYMQSVSISAADTNTVSVLNDGNDSQAVFQAAATPKSSQSLLTAPVVQDEPLMQDITTKQVNYWHEVLGNIGLIWIGGALVLFSYKIFSYRRFVRTVSKGAKKVSDTYALDIYRNELLNAKVKNELPIYINAQVASPMLVGIIQPALLVPTLNVSDKELRYIIQHELIHYNRLDFLYKWVVQITLCLHWFNPLLYFVRTQINKSCELSCDEAVIKHLDEDGRIAYGDTLIASLKIQGKCKDYVASMSMSGNGKLIKERLDTIMSYNRKSRLVIIISALLTVVLISGATFIGAYAADNTSEKHEEILDTMNLTLNATDPAEMKEAMGAPDAEIIEDTTELDAEKSVYDKSMVYESEDGKVIIQFSIESITKGPDDKYGFVCLGQIPNINNAKRITYTITTDSGSGIFAAMSTDDMSLTDQYTWYNYIRTYEKSITHTWESESTSVFTLKDGLQTATIAALENAKREFGRDLTYSGNYYLYVGTNETELTNIVGTIVIEY